MYNDNLFNEYRMSDIEELDLSQYKLIVFYNPMLLTKEQFDNLQSRIRSDCQILFANLPGVCTDTVPISIKPKEARVYIARDLIRK